MTGPRLRIVVVLKTVQGGLWTVLQIEEMLRRGHQVAVIVPRGPGPLRDALSRLNIRVLATAFDFRFRPGLATLRALWRLRGEIAGLRPDVVHYHLYASALAARLATIGMPVARVHMVAGPLYLESGVIRRLERVLSRLDHVVVGGSAYTAHAYRELGLSAARTPSIPYGVDTAAFTPPSARARAAARASLDLSADVFAVVMVAYVYAPKRSVYRGRGIKGHDLLLDAWRRFAGVHPDARLLLVGDGFDAAGKDYRRHLLRQHQVDRQPSIRWIRSVEDVRRYYAAADLSVSPSLSENHGAALEASAMGVPCLVSDAGGLPETVDGECGWVVASGEVEPLTAALEDAHRSWCAGTLRQRGAAARERTVALFDRRAAAVRLIDIIEHTRGADLPDPR